MKKLLLLITTLLFVFTLSSCLNGEQMIAVNNVNSLISALPDEASVTINDETAIYEARDAYEALDENLKTHITDADKITILTITVEDLKTNAVNEVIMTIDLLPSTDSVTTSSIPEEKAADARTAYDALRQDLQALVTNYDKLTALETKISEVKKVIEDNQTAATKVVDAINAIPDEVSLDDEATITSARTLLNALTKEQKAYVTNDVKLANAEYQLSVLKTNKVNQDKANEVINLITSLPTTIKSTDEGQINAARTAYDALTADQKKLVTNYTNLTDAEKALVTAKQNEENEKVNNVITLINAIPTTVKESDSTTISKARTAYDALSTTLQAKVTNYSKLTKAEEDYANLSVNPSSFRVNYILNGGTLASAMYGAPSSQSSEVTSLAISKFDVNFFSVYSTNVVLFSKSYLSTDGNSYAYNLKVGISYDNSSKCYKVTNIYEDGTALDSTSKAANDYVIVCNGELATEYANLQTLQVGDVLSVVGTMPTTGGNCNITFNVTRESTTTGTPGYYNNFTGATTLATPSRTGYKFGGWYTTSNFTGSEVTLVSKACTVYAKWIKDSSKVETDSILDCVSDIVETSTIDELIASNDDATFKWSSSNTNLYVIEGTTGKAVMGNQTHKKQEVTITCSITYKKGGTKTVSKKVTINPIKFDDLPDTPVATYFNVSASYSYRAYNTRYQTEGTYFSDTALNTLNIVYYSFATPSANGSLSLASESTFGPILKKLKQQGIRVLVSIEGTSTTSANVFDSIARSTDGTLQTFAKNCVNMLEKWNFDGIDLDWEGTNMTATTYTAIMKAIKTEMESRQDEGGTPYMLTAAVPAYCWGSETKRYNWSDMNKYLDLLNIMSYDANASNYASHVSPHYNSEKDNAYGKYGVSGVGGVERYVKLGFPASKILIGCAGYGKSYKVTGTSKYSQYPGLGAAASLCIIPGYESKGSHASGTVFGNVISDLLKDKSYKVYTEVNSKGQIVGSYMYNETTKIFVSYESEEEIQAKLAYCDETPGLGVMCWAHNEDTSDNYINAVAKYKGTTK